MCRDFVSDVFVVRTPSSIYGIAPTSCITHIGDTGAVAGANMDGDRPMKRTFLVSFDYGMGGHWAYVRAESADAITRAFPELTVVHHTPKWMTREIQEMIRTAHTYDLEEEPRGLLSMIIEQRGKRS